MHAELADLARKHALQPQVVRDLESLWNRRVAQTTMVAEWEGLSLASATSDSREPPSGDPKPLDQPHPEGGAARIGGRYDDLGPIGTGGMGEVRRVRDLRFHRTLAMKTMHARLASRPGAVARFLDEAQATGQLQHPGIVPIHDLGALPDGRLWFTMKEVRGRTLTEVLREVHAAATDRWNPGATGFTFRRLVSCFLAVCQAVAYAHERGVVHRDLKPGNVMIGAHGEVMVLDWGLAKILGRAERPFEGDDGDGEDEGTVVTARSGSYATRLGTVAGTPAYMPPEQARGEVDKLDARADVYALGAILYEILSGRPPYQGPAHDVVLQVLRGAPVPVSSRATASGHWLANGQDERPSPPLPDELVAVCERAMARDPRERYPSALALAAEVEAWLDGARRREQALDLVEHARQVAAAAEALAASAAERRAESTALLADVAPWEPEERKAPGWRKAEEAAEASLAAELEQLEVDETLRAALQVSPDLPEAHAALAERHLARHAAAEAIRRPVQTSERLMLAHATALPEAHPVRKRVTAYLTGDGALSLVTDPPGAEVLLYRYVVRNRRLVEVFDRSLGNTPLQAIPMPMGSYLAVVRRPGCAEVRYPFEVTRRGHWDGVPPGERQAHPVWLPPEGFLGPDEVYLPAGWFRAGTVSGLGTHPAMRLWCDALVMDRFPVTNARYLAFLDDLVAQGRVDEALRHAPREKGGTVGEAGALIYGFDGRRFSLRPDADGDAWLPDWPVLRVDWYGARAYEGWLAQRTGRGWRLVCELEREKAARGVDGRLYPYGDAFDSSWGCTVDSHRGRPVVEVVDSYPVDTSPYGVRGLAGNSQDWCLDLFDAPPAVVEGRVSPPDADSYAASRASRVVKGGAWDASAHAARSAARGRFGPESRRSCKGFRGAFRPLA